MNNVLFLDFDGPIFPDVHIHMERDNFEPYPGQHIDGEGLTYWKADPVFVNFYNRLQILHPFKTVVSSTWGKVVEFDLIRELFEVNKINVTFHDDCITPEVGLGSPFGYRSTRALEIQTWLGNHPEVDDYLILDDPWSGSCLDSNKHNLNKDSIFLVNPDVGLDTQLMNDMRHYVKLHWAKQFGGANLW